MNRWKQLSLSSEKFAEKRKKKKGDVKKRRGQIRKGEGKKRV